MKTTITILLGCALWAQGQTPNTNDVAQTVALQLNYSTNQVAGLRWAYRQHTNALPEFVPGTTNLTVAPTFIEWHRDSRRSEAGATADDYARQRKDAEAALQSFRDLRDRWAELTPAQRTAVLNAAGL